MRTHLATSFLRQLPTASSHTPSPLSLLVPAATRYGFLVSNAELLSVDLKSISYVDADAPRAEQYKCISGYLDLLVELLKWYPARKKESRMLKEMVKKYRLLAANALDETLPSLCNVKPKELNKWQKSDKFIFSIVR